MFDKTLARRKNLKEAKLSKKFFNYFNFQKLFVSNQFPFVKLVLENSYSFNF